MDVIAVSLGKPEAVREDALPQSADVNRAFAALKTAKVALSLALEAELDGKAELMLRRACWLLERGKEAGANDSERDARFRLAYPHEHTQQALAEKLVREHRLDLDLCQLEIDRLKLLVRLEQAHREMSY